MSRRRKYYEPQMYWPRNAGVSQVFQVTGGFTCSVLARHTRLPVLSTIPMAEPESAKDAAWNFIKELKL